MKLLNALALTAALITASMPGRVEAASDLEAALDAVEARRPELTIPIHANDYRTMGERVASEELIKSETVSSWIQKYLKDQGQFVMEQIHRNAIHIDEGQTGFADVRGAMLEVLPQLGIEAQKVALYTFQGNDIRTFAFDLAGLNGPAIVALSSRLVGDVRQYVTDPQQRQDVFRYLVAREAARIARGDSALNAISLIARSAENTANGQGDAQASIYLYRSGLPGLLLPQVQEMIKHVQRLLVGQFFRRYTAWNVNSEVSLNRAAIAAVSRVSTPERAFAAAKWCHLLGILQDARLVESVDVKAYVNQLQESVKFTHEGISITEPGEAAEAADVGTEVRKGILFKLCRTLMGWLGLPTMGGPVGYNGNILLLTDQVINGTTGAYTDLLPGHRTQVQDRALRALVRLARLDMLRGVNRPKLEAGQGGSDDAARAEDVAKILEASIDDLLANQSTDGAPDLKAWTEGVVRLTEASFPMQSAGLWILEGAFERLWTSGDPDMAIIDEALIDLRYANAVRNAESVTTVRDFFEELNGGRQISVIAASVFHERHGQLLERLRRALSTQEQRDRTPARLATWVKSSGDRTKRRVLEPLVDLLAKGFEQGGRPELAAAVRAALTSTGAAKID